VAFFISKGHKHFKLTFAPFQIPITFTAAPGNDIQNLIMRDHSIPAVLFNEDSKAPHRECRICQKNLMDGELYAIQKVFKNYPDQEAQALFDFALCKNCMEQARAELSKESRLRIDQFMMEGLENLEASGEEASDRWEQHRCTLSGTYLQESNEFQMMAVCQGESLVDSPVCLSAEMLETIQELLSPESREELNRFSENNFGWPPELKKALVDGDIVLL